MTAQRFDMRTAPESLLREMYDLRLVRDAEANPDDPKWPFETYLAAVRNAPLMNHSAVVIVRADDGSLAGTGTTSFRDVPENRHVIHANIYVHPHQRGKGLAWRLLGDLAGEAEHQQRSLMIGETVSRLPAGEDFCRHIGAEVGLVMHENRLDLKELDRTLIEGWLREAPARADGYDLVYATAPIPEEMVADAVEIMHVMNTAPRQDLQVEDDQFTVEQWRMWEQTGLKTGTIARYFFAREQATGRFAGLTSVFQQPAVADRVFQGDTGVMPDHRGRGLGKWLKAAMLDRLLNELPDLRWIVTYNANSNEPMLAINHALGFKPHADETSWQLTAEAARARLP